MKSLDTITAPQIKQIMQFCFDNSCTLSFKFDKPGQLAITITLQEVAYFNETTITETIDLWRLDHHVMDTDRTTEIQEVFAECLARCYERRCSGGDCK